MTILSGPHHGGHSRVYTYFCSTFASQPRLLYPPLAFGQRDRGRRAAVPGDLTGSFAWMLGASHVLGRERQHGLDGAHRMASIRLKIVDNPLGLMLPAMGPE